MPSPLSLHSRLVCGCYRRIWLGRVASPTPPLPPGSLVLAGHYNGAVDGFAYGSQIPPFVAVISAQWHRSALGRALLPGISVQRAKDGVSGAANLGAFRAVLGRLRSGDRILFFPEGTSRLGRERLPVQPGTLLLLRQARKAPVPPPVFFASARYDEPQAWRSSVSIGWVGPVGLPGEPALDAEWVASGLMRAQEAADAMPVPGGRPHRILAPLAALPYLPVWILVSALARRRADGDNVVALWRFLFGVPLTLAALCIYTLLCGAAGWPLWAPFASLAAGWLLWTR
jgi:1-acyl-sn-glycerol-3-phosphate acyltransferase